MIFLHIKYGLIQRPDNLPDRMIGAQMWESKNEEESIIC